MRALVLLACGALVCLAAACADLTIDPAYNSIQSVIDSPSFRADLMPVLRQTCGSSGACHGGAAPQEDLKLDDDSAAYATLVNVPAHFAGAAATGMMRVAPGKPDSSFMLRVLSESTSVRLGYYRMPLTEYYLPADPIRLTIKNWISKGALYN